MNVFELAASLTLDSSQFSSELTAAEKLANGFAGVLGSAVGRGVKAIGDLTEQAIDSYSAYQQLAGGIKEAYGDSARIVTQNAQNAFKTAGINANKYLETAGTFSAALIKSLGGDTEKAAEYVDKAIVDMSDNVNTWGTSMESAMNAYRGFAKQEYRMLDNLFLGYGGSKKGMEQLLEDAAALSGQEYDISNLNDIIDAIHVIQTELGITGRTVTEAEDTVEGAMKTARAAWDNLITEFGKPNADIGARVHEWAQAATVSAKNVLPVMKNVLSGLGAALQAAWPEVQAVIGELWTVIEPVLQEVWGHIKETVSGWANDLLGNIPLLGDILKIPQAEKTAQAALTNTAFGGTQATQGMGFWERFNFLNQQGSAAISEYTEQMAEVPEEVTTTANADTSGAIAAVNDLIDAINSIPTDVTVNVSGNYSGADPNGISDARSMSGGTILRGATMFGWDREGIPHIGGGEGAEAVVGVNSLNQMIHESVTGAVSSLMNGLGGMISGGQRQPAQLVLDTGVLVAAIAPNMNDEMSRIDTWRHGGDR